MLRSLMLLSCFAVREADPLPGPARTPPGSRCRSSHLFKRCDNLRDGRRRCYLAISASAQTRLESGQVARDLDAVLGVRPERVGSVDNPGQDDLDRRAQENHRIEAFVQGALVHDAAGNEEPAFAVSVQERADLIEVPHRLGSIRRLDLDDPARFAGVDDQVTTAGELGQRGRLPGAGHAGHEDGRSLRERTHVLLILRRGEITRLACRKPNRRRRARVPRFGVDERRAAA